MSAFELFDVGIDLAVDLTAGGTVWSSALACVRSYVTQAWRAVRLTRGGP